MGSKNFNFFEKHAEKIAMALGVAGAGYLLWLSLQSYRIPNTELSLDNAEGAVTKAVRDLKAAETNTKKRIFDVRVPDMVRIYEESLRNPIPQVLLATVAPHFVPFQLPVTPGTGGPLKPPGAGLVITPTVPAPFDSTARSWPDLIDSLYDSQHANAYTADEYARPVTGIPSKDKNLAVITGSLPIDAFNRSMNAPEIDIPERLPSSLQVSIIYRVEAQRRPKIERRNEAAWADVAIPAGLPVFPNNPINAGPARIDVVIDALRESVTNIIRPPHSPDVDAVLSRMISVSAAGQPRFDGEPGTAHVTNDPVYWIVDEIHPAVEYEYRVRLAMFNPTFNYMFEGKPGQLKDESMRNQVVIRSDWAIVPDTVEIPSDMYFYVMGYSSPTRSFPNTPGVNVSFYKQVEGYWFVERNRTIYLGNAIAGNIIIPARPAQGEQPEQPRKVVPIETNHFVVDILGGGSGLGSSVEVVLLDPDGNLIVRRQSTDRDDEQRLKLEDQLKKQAELNPRPVPQKNPRPTPPGPKRP